MGSYTRLSAQSITIPTSIRGSTSTYYVLVNNPSDINIVGGPTAVTTNDGDASYLNWNPAPSGSSNVQAAEVYFGTDPGIKNATRVIMHMTMRLQNGAYRTVTAGWNLSSCQYSLSDGGGHGILSGTDVLYRRYLECEKLGAGYSMGWNTHLDATLNINNSGGLINPSFDPSTGIYSYIYLQFNNSQSYALRITEVYIEYTTDPVTPGQQQTPYIVAAGPAGNVVVADAAGNILADRYINTAQYGPIMLWTTGEVTTWNEYLDPLRMITPQLDDDVWWKYPDIGNSDWINGNINDGSWLANYENNTMLVQLSHYPSNSLDLYQVSYGGALLSIHHMGVDDTYSYLDTGDVYQGKLYFLANDYSNFSSYNSTEHLIFPGYLRCFNLSTNLYESVSVDIWDRIGSTDYGTDFRNVMTMAIDPANGDMWFCAMVPYFQNADGSQWTPGFCFVRYTINGTFVGRYDFLQNLGYIFDGSNHGLGSMTILGGDIYVFMAGTFFLGPAGQTRWEKDGAMKFSMASLSPTGYNTVPDMWRGVAEDGAGGWVARPMLGGVIPPLRMTQRDDVYGINSGHARLSINSDVPNQASSQQMSRSPRLPQGGQSYV